MSQLGTSILRRAYTYIVILDVAQCSLLSNRVETILISLITSLIHICVIAKPIRIESLTDSSTGLDEVQALGKSCHGGSICRVVEDLEAIGIIGSHDRVEWNLSLGVNASVDQAKGFDGQ